MSDLKMGLIIVLLGSIKKIFDIYYEKNILPKKSIIEQEQYKEIEIEKSKKGFYDVPFTNGKLIGHGNTIHTFNNAIIVIGIIFIIINFL